MTSLQTGINRAKMIDPVTGLLNQSALVSRLEQLLSQERSDSPFALLLIHIGNLQSMVDGFSDLIVDEVSKKLSSRLQESIGALPDSCLAARIGSDKFAVLLLEHAEEGPAVELAAQIQKEIELPFEWRNHRISMRISIGIRIGAGHNGRAEDVFWDADTALSQAIKLGKTRRIVYRPDMRKRAIARLALESELRQAIEQHNFILHYQPKVTLRSRKLAGFEALVRWNHPQHGLIAPSEFIPVAEETGLIVRLGEWVLDEACCQMSAWRQASQAAALNMSVNLSSQQLVQENLVEHVRYCLRKHSIAAEALHLEITETSVMENMALVLETMKGLRDLKVNLCIDDFGTGHSSLGYLHQFPFKTLKIDRSFVANMKRKGTLAIIRAILKLSHALGISVVAEGIETPEQANQLEHLGCDYGQGYFFSKPVEASAATAMIPAGKLPIVAQSQSKIARFGTCLSPNPAAC